MLSVLMVVFLIFPHELFVELFSSWSGDIRRLHVGVPKGAGYFSGKKLAN